MNTFFFRGRIILILGLFLTAPTSAKRGKGKGKGKGGSDSPSFAPSDSPSYLPTVSKSPSGMPSSSPSNAPSTSKSPSNTPSLSQGPSSSPSFAPSYEPSISMAPSVSAMPSCQGKGKGKADKMHYGSKKGKAFPGKSSKASKKSSKGCASEDEETLISKYEVEYKSEGVAYAYVSQFDEVPASNAFCLMSLMINVYCFVMLAGLVLW